MKLILPMVDELLNQNKISLSDIDVIGFNHGPGSFTGLRIGMGVVQGLAFGANIPVIPISTLQTMAQAAIDKGLVGDSLAEEDQFIMPAIDARMNEVYWGIYKNVGGYAQSVCSDALNKPEEIHATIQDNTDLSSDDISDFAESRYVGIGDGWQYRDRISLKSATIDEQLTSDAEQVLGLTLDAFKRGMSVSVDQVEPLYLRNTVSWVKRQRIRENN